MKYCEPLPRSFYSRSTLTVAKELLGKLLVRQTADGNIVARIVEVEAYRGKDDPASHAYRGMTERNRVMFGEPGHAYVYFTYGMHYCLNVKTETQGVPGAVLIRAVEILEGIQLALKNRKLSSITGLANGPAKVTQALRIGKSENGIDLVARVQSDKLFLCEPEQNENLEISTSSRIGIKTGRDNLWRFYITDNKVISR